MREGERTPKAAVVVSIDQVLLHCGKAINRAKLWADSAHLDASALPTVGSMVAALGKLDNPEAALDADQLAQIDVHYTHAVRTELY